MPLSTQDLLHGIDFTGINPASGGDHNNLVDQSAPVDDGGGYGKGLVIVTKDQAVNTPDVPNAVVTGKWSRYLWIRIPHNAATDLKPKAYAWNIAGPNDVTFLHWTVIAPSTADFQAQIDVLGVIANSALLSANAANVTASNANSNAATALTNANAAETSANNAAALAGTANTNATNAGNAASQASTDAANALAAANAQKSVTTALLHGPIALQQVRTNRGVTAVEWFSPVDLYVSITEQYAKNTDGLNAVLGANIRQFNTKITDPGNLAITIVAGVITLRAGTYYVKARYASRGKLAQGFLIKNSDNSLLLEGTSDWINIVTGSSNHSFGSIDGVITLAADTAIRVDHYFSGAVANGQGLACNLGPGGSHEVYATFEARLIG